MDPSFPNVTVAGLTPPMNPLRLAAMFRILTAALVFTIGIGLSPSSGQQTARPPGAPATDSMPLKVLFLGDRGHHDPADRAAQITPVLAGRGIQVTYTERLDDLNPATLAGYDALVIYANIDDISPAQDKALLEYVEGGGAFVPLHCASFCFRNSPRYVALVGRSSSGMGRGPSTRRSLTRRTRS